MTWIDVVDVLRVIGLVLASGTIAVSIVVTRAHWAVYRARRSSWRGLLPRHVYLVGVSYTGLLLWAMEDMMQRFHSGMTWRVPALFILAGAGLVAMWDVLGHQRHRVIGTSHVHDDVNAGPDTPGGDYAA